MKTNTRSYILLIVIITFLILLCFLFFNDYDRIATEGRYQRRMHYESVVHYTLYNINAYYENNHTLPANFNDINTTHADYNSSYDIAERNKLLQYTLVDKTTFRIVCCGPDNIFDPASPSLNNIDVVRRKARGDIRLTFSIYDDSSVWRFHQMYSSTTNSYVLLDKYAIGEQGDVILVPPNKNK
jgi:hypothetical protein